MKIKQDNEVKGRERKLRKKKEILRRGEYKREKIKIRERDNRERERERERKDPTEVGKLRWYQYSGYQVSKP